MVWPRYVQLQLDKYRFANVPKHESYTDIHDVWSYPCCTNKVSKRLRLMNLTPAACPISLITLAQLNQVRLHKYCMCDCCLYKCNEASIDTGTMDCATHNQPASNKRQVFRSYKVVPICHNIHEPSTVRIFWRLTHTRPLKIMFNLWCIQAFRMRAAYRDVITERVLDRTSTHYTVCR